MKKKVFLYLSTGLALVLLSASTPSNNPASTETTSLVDDWLIVGSPISVFTPGEPSISVGYNARATGNNSLAIGPGARALGYSSVALGYFATASGSTSFASGQSTTASGDYSFSTGYLNSAIGYTSIALGFRSRSIGRYSTAIGQNTQSLGSDSIALGRDTVASGRNTTVVGIANDLEGALSNDSADQLNRANHLFVIGNGRGINARSNALVTKHSGETNLINREWNSSAPLTESADDGHGNTGEALIVAGHTRLKGKVIIEQAQGDISMGIFGQ